MLFRRGLGALQKQDGMTRRESAGAWTTSLFLHALLLFLLSCFLFNTKTEGLLTLNANRSESNELLEFVAAEPTAAAPESLADTFDQPIEIPSMADAEHDLAALEKFDWLEIDAIDELELPGESPSTAKSPKRSRPQRQMPWQIRQPAGSESIRSAAGVAAAFGLVEQAIRDEYSQGDTLVVWLLDASISLQLNRHLIAQRLAQFQASIGAANKQQGLASRDRDHRLFHSVVAFGQGVSEVQGPTLTGLRVVDEIKRLRSDPSGVEQTMYAVNQVVQWYRGSKRRHERMMVVLLTDESGDDGFAIETTIQNCRQNGVAVHVIGPTAVMGLEEGSQLWTSDSNQRFLLKVKRGPETCLPERVFLPYWHELRLSAWRPDVRPADSVPWYGGEYREGVLSGFGPYTLTRLALETGGSYTRFDQGGDARYDPESLRPYLPDYGSLAEYQASIGDRPLRRFVARAAQMTMAEAGHFVPLPMMYFGERSRQYPYPVISQFIEPGTFRRRLRNAIRLEMKRAAMAAQRIEALLQEFAQVDMEYEYSNEDSARWRAWHDLTMGRLLAASVRYAEFIAVAELLSARNPPLGQEVNEVLLLAGSQFRVPASAERAAEARRLLDRCRYANESTPWSDLADWELGSDFGIRIQPRTIPRPRPVVNQGFQPGQMGLKTTNTLGGGGGGGGMSFPSL